MVGMVQIVGFEDRNGLRLRVHRQFLTLTIIAPVNAWPVAENGGRMNMNRFVLKTTTAQGAGRNSTGPIAVTGPFLFSDPGGWLYTGIKNFDPEGSGK
jgi:hypothetical protein